MAVTKKKKSRRAKKARMPARVEDGTFKPFKPTAEQRQLVENMAAFGIDQEAIAKIIGVAHGTLHTHFRDELDIGLAKMISTVAGRLFQSAMKGDTTAAIFILKTRGRWSERILVEDMSKSNLTIVLHPGGAPDGKAYPKQITVGHDTLTVEHQPHQPDGSADSDNH